MLRNAVDLSDGYVEVMGQLIRSEGCFGRILPDESLEVVPFQLNIGGKGPVLTADNLVSIEPIASNIDPADRYVVTYSAAERVN
jgi:hypothetical protein